ncbi:MAG TPA: 4-hydroxy-3-methylbut-2-enyl diphosphate reductase [Rhodothermales bacterium]|nr:4-hydroxy-3-methylbut-2-enyl diphosphate reductase [Rhodothermales bacterium]
MGFSTHQHKQKLRSQKMARTFDVPVFYKSTVISTVKEVQKVMDPRKRDLRPAVLDYGPIRFKIARHFGFCFGVEQAVDIAYRAIEENKEKQIFLLSEMIHNQQVNEDLKARGVRFLRSTTGEQLIPFESLTPHDIVIIPAFGASLEVEQALQKKGVDVQQYDTTCPFVMKVWKRSAQIGQSGFTIVVHGKRYHEETRATFSRAKETSPVVVVRDLEEAQLLAEVIRGERDTDFFYQVFAGRYSEGFDPQKDLQSIGVVNQTTMLATETQAIVDLLRQAVEVRYGAESLHAHFADTSDTLCYATNENQSATRALIDDGGDLAIVVGGYNSSNTSHLVELCEEVMPTYFISHADEIASAMEISHFLYASGKRIQTRSWFPNKRPLDIVLTAGASCPDSLLEEILRKIVGWFPDARSDEDVLEGLKHNLLSLN